MPALIRKIGTTGIEASALGAGCWAIGGPAFDKGGHAIGWGDVSDKDSVAGLEAALDMGITLFDTSNMYGAGHSESLLGKTLKGKRDRVVLSTKFGWVFDPATKTKLGHDTSPAYIRSSLEGSLQRLGTDYIDVYFLHVPVLEARETPEILETLEALVGEGKIRTYGWSTDSLDCAKIFAEAPGCGAIQFSENIFEDNAGMIRLCEEKTIAAFNRAPLAMGTLTGKFKEDSRLNEKDIRGKDGSGGIRFFKDGKVDPAYIRRVEAIREILTEGGRTPAQGALGWLWARSETCIPIPGFKNKKQVEDNAKAMEFGPLTEKQMAEIAGILDEMK